MSAAEDYPYRPKIPGNYQWALMCQEINTLRADVAKLLTMLADAGVEWDRYPSVTHDD